MYKILVCEGYEQVRLLLREKNQYKAKIKQKTTYSPPKADMN